MYGGAAYAQGVPLAEVSLPATPTSVPTARGFVGSVLTDWGQAPLADTATLLVSELATNCALHAGTAFTVRLRLDDDGVRVEVADRSARLPQLRSFGPGATTGRGLQLVAALAADWGVEAAAGGKTVWVRLEGSDREDAVDALLAAYG